ncbi:MATE family efflux transporter [Aquibaculum sediminis]|uniref:MATE family efflux transporter n=1 Tax=Aquibaculum sediminis TaxID=3231907 RepID=UPI0034546AE5
MTIAQTASAARPDSEAITQWELYLREGRAIIRLATPIALIALVNMGMSITDSVMVSLLFGTEALASVAVGSDLYSIFFYLCAGVLAGLAPFYTAAVTRADAQDRAKLERIGWATVSLLAVLIVPLVWFAPLWLSTFGLQASLLEEGQGYTRAMALTLIPMLGVVLYRTLLTAAERPKLFLKVTLAMVPLNAVANYLFMTGIGPMPTLGATGAGVASLLVAIVSLAAIATLARHSATAGKNGEHGPNGRAVVDWQAMAAVLRVGVPIGIATVTEIGIFLAATLYAARLGVADVAAHTLALRTAGVAYAIPAALLQASMVRAARAESLDDRGARQAVMVSSLGLSVILGIALCLLLAGGAEMLARAFFDHSAEGISAMRLAMGLLLLLDLIELIAGPSCAASGLLRGRRITRLPMIYVLLGYWGISAPLAIYLCEAKGFGITGLWIGLAAGTSMTAILMIRKLLASNG